MLIWLLLNIFISTWLKDWSNKTLDCAAPLTCMAADVDPQRAVAGKLLSTVRADFLLLSCVCLAEER